MVVNLLFWIWGLFVGAFGLVLGGWFGFLCLLLGLLIDACFRLVYT